MKRWGFKSGDLYTKNDLYRVCNIPTEKQKGNWNTGYTNYNGN